MERLEDERIDAQTIKTDMERTAQDSSWKLQVIF